MKTRKINIRRFGSYECFVLNLSKIQNQLNSNMNKIILTISFMFGVALCPHQIKAGAENNGVKTCDNVVRLQQDVPSKRPSSPAKYSIVCEYSSGYLSFKFPPNVDAVNIILGDEMFPVWVGFVNKVNPEVEIPELHGEVQIVCITDSGSMFKGVLQF